MKIERNIGDTSTASELGVAELPPDTRMKLVDGWKQSGTEIHDAAWSSEAIWIVLGEGDQKIKRF